MNTSYVDTYRICLTTVISTLLGTELSDFVLSTQTITFQAGVEDGIQSVSVFAVQDGFKESSETITCSFTGPPGVEPIAPTTATVTILDDDGKIT